MYETTSCLLFHGPGAEPMASGRALEFGKLIPFDTGVMKKDGARALVEILSSFPVGSGRRSILVGPMDEVQAQTSDVLLKSLEEFDPRGVRPFLWAWDLGGVSSTVKSRCVCLFAPGTDDRLSDIRPLGMSLLKAFKTRDWVGLVEILRGDDGSKEEGAKKAPAMDLALLLRSTVDELARTLEAPEPDPRLDALWVQLRPLFSGATLTPARVVSAFLEADGE